MSEMRNRQWLIAARPVGRDVVESDFEYREANVRAPGAGEAVVRVELLGFDPALKGWMENIGGYVAPTEIGDIMRGRGIGTVIDPGASGLAKGAKVAGTLGWQDYATVPASELEIIEDDAQLSHHLGVLGSTGLTAYLGLRHIGQPFPGDTMVITGAAGAVGSVVGQIGKIAGCRVIGIAGGADKCRMLVDELGFDAALDYREGNLSKRMKELAPGGIDVLWDNVGGVILDDLLARIAMHARVVICGGISRSKTGGMPVGPSNYFNIVFKRATMRGFILMDHAAEYDEARTRLKRWIADGRLQSREDMQVGLENAPRTLMRLFEGKNVGKQLLRVTD
ncbi:NADP-dependent oxidoreductase [Sphingomonas oryzagri]|uniref:NADP-dependent oxidoreductase n=1 Tax=Sphingomonas oryzagri TaxID=3042314 RepID=A0ABT6MWQ8_9SPHN|nr:NADP-dependent oxidoreductase [Sphingomonas oryzagri]MDH7637411.1 NADP-dependent oxidoreductase [Sphingomonas oryzagri]